MSFLRSTCMVLIGITSASASEAEASCLGLIGIKSGGGDGELDLDMLIGDLEINSFVLGTGPGVILSCLAVLETPVAMRYALGELPTTFQAFIN